MILNTTWPCCGRPARVKVSESMGRQIVRKICRPCETAYDVVRVLLVQGSQGQVDSLTWQDTRSTDYRRRYG